jgi:putative spermidine/putrescine transport system permease protein
MESKGLRVALRIWVVLVLAFLFVPIALIVLYAFNRSNIESWPISGFSGHWFAVAWHDTQVRSAFLLSVKVGLLATVLAVLLGSAVAYALHQYRFFGREAISFLPRRPAWSASARSPDQPATSPSANLRP